MGKTFTIKYSSKFVVDYKAIRKYLCDNLSSKTAGKNFEKNVNKCILNIKTMPFTYKAFTTKRNLPFKVRYAYAANYVVFYHVEKNEIILMRICYAKRNLQNIDM